MTAPDFSGYATRNDLVCSDGRTILADAFKDNHGMVVPLVYQHSHDDIEDVLGHVKLENRADGVFCHAFFNETAKGKAAKEAVRHGDIRFLSIFANQLVERAKKVLKGSIKEVSLVLAGANPGATIEAVNMAHSAYDDDYVIEEANITTGMEIELPVEAPEFEFSHADSSTSTESDTDGAANDLDRILSTLNKEQETAVNYLLVRALTDGGSVQHSDMDADADADADTEAAADAEGDVEDDTDVEASADADADSETETNADADADADADATADATEDAEDGADADTEAEADADAASDTDAEATADADTTEAGDAVQHDNINQEDTSMTHNLFDQAGKGGATGPQRATLSHDDVKSIMREVVDGNTKLSTVLKHYVATNGVTVDGELKHGIENIDYLFPDFKTLENSPAFISRRMEWVDKVLGAVRKAPFARIKTVTADITPDEARARGYITGNMKNEEYFELSKRETTPQTVYKKQKLDRDDVIDIADFEVIAWLKAEMKVMLDEELASAILFGDGRSSGDEDKIKEANIRPIASDAELYTTQVYVNLDDANSSAEELVDSAIVSRELYKGSGQPTFYTTQAYISKFKLAKDGNGQRYYKSNADIAAALDVADVVAVETMSRVPDLVGIMVNLADYTIGTDRGGQATMFDDFDLDYNKLIYLLETRVSGALTTPKAALAFRKVAAAAALVSPDAPAFNKTTGVLTVPTKTGVTYKNDSNATLTTGSPVTVPAGQSYHVTAVPASGSYYFADNAHDEWTFTTDPA